MGAPTNVAPVIIKRKKIIVAGGHHGGAWKVAYADFVTAMMAFFMLMWLLGATTEKQRKGIADYFSPTIPINRVSGGGDGPFAGDLAFSESTATESSVGGSQKFRTASRQAEGAAAGPKSDDGKPEKTDNGFADIENELTGQTGESMVSPEQLRHIVTRVTDEGLIIELTALDDSPLFEAGTDKPTEMLRALTGIIVRVTRRVENDMAVGGHVRANPVVLIENPVWDLSLARAARMQALMQGLGSDPARFRRVTGFADRKPAIADPMAARNNRIEVVLLRN
jgi:chemotaxis protein MotB